MCIPYSLSPAPRPAGPLPPSLSQSSLRYLAVASNSLEGPLPALPPSLVILNVSDNRLSGKMPKLPDALLSLDISINKFNGTLPGLNEV